MVERDEQYDADKQYLASIGIVVDESEPGMTQTLANHITAAGWSSPDLRPEGSGYDASSELRTGQTSSETIATDGLIAVQALTKLLAQIHHSDRR